MAGITHQWLIDGQDFGPPTNWMDFEIEGTFAQENDDELIPENQPNLSVDRLEFSGRAATYISNRFRGGLNGGKSAFDGPSISWVIADGSGAYTAFDGYIDYTDNYLESQFKGENRTLPNKVTVKIVDDFGLNALLQKVNGITTALLYDKNVFSSSDWTDIPFVVAKKFDYTELLLLQLGVTILLKELYETLERVQKLAADLAGGLTGPIVFGLKLIALVIYFYSILFQLIILAQKLIDLIYSPLRTHKGVTLRTLLSKGFEYAGYTFISPIEELDNYTILPTLPTEKSKFTDPILNRVRVTKTGLPSVNDWGFLFTENLTTCRRLFNARLAVYNNGGTKEVHLRTDSDDWWFKQSNLTLIDEVLIDEVGYNTNELKLDRYLKFATDTTDEWTKENLRGTSYEVITELPYEAENPLLKGLDEIQIPYALGVRKGELTFLEKELKAILGLAETVVNALGGNANYTNKIEQRVNALKVSGFEIAVAKLLYIKDGGIPTNHRDLLSAKYLQDKYLRSKSFVNASDDAPFNNQYQTFEGVTIQFDLQKFLSLRNNSYFITKEGESGKIENFRWNPSKDRGVFDGRIRSVYDKSLTERTIELTNDDGD